MPTQAPKEMHGGRADATPAEPSQMTRLEQMRERLASLSDEARSIRAQMPREFEPDVERIQQQMQRLGERLSELSGSFVYQTALPKPAVRETMTRTHPQSASRPPTQAPAPAPTQTEPTQTMSRTGGDEGARVTRVAPDEVIMLSGPANTENPWSEESARALTRFYESGEAFLGYAREAAHAAVNAAKPQTAVPPGAAPAPSHLCAVPATSHDHPTLSAIEPAWLDQRLAEIAARIEQSLAEIRPENSLLTLGHRFDQLEARMSSALDGMATRADLKDLRLAETQIEEISAQLDQLRRQFARLDAIDAHLGTLATQLSDERLTKLFNTGMASSRDAARLESISSQLATIAGQLSHERLADLISQNAVRSTDLEEIATAAAQKAAARFADREAREMQTRDIGEVRGLLESLINERRHSDENNASMLEMMQQAIIRVLDRIDALEIAQQEVGAPQHATYAPIPMQSAEAESEVAEHTFAPPPPDEPDYDAPQQHAYAPAHEEAPPVRGMFTSPPFDLDAAFATDRDSVHSNYVMPDASAQPIDARHDFIADAHRAKLKAASKIDNKLDPHLGRAGEMLPAERAPAQSKPRKRRGFFRSPRVLMSILTVLAMIPAALFFMPRTPSHGRALPAAAELAMPTVDAPAPVTTPNADDATPPAAVPQDGEDFSPPAQAAPPAPSKQSQRMVPDAQPGARDFEDVGAPNPTPDPKTHRLDSAALSPAAFAPEAARLAFLQGRHVPVGPKATPAALMEQHVIGQNGAVAPGEALTGTSSPPRLPPAMVGPYSLRLAAAQGDAAAQFEVAARIAEGKGTDKDLKDAAQWYQRSASSGFALAQFRLGTFYERGTGVEKDLARAKVWYGRAADQGNVKAMHNLAVLIAGHGGPTPDYATAVKWFSEAAAHGLADSQYNLAMLYESGLGVPKDAKEAYKWLLLAANSGDAEAKSRLDTLKATLSSADVAAASVAAECWRPKRTDPMANDSNVAGQAWNRSRTNNG